jgi:hypothetical protein
MAIDSHSANDGLVKVVPGRGSDIGVEAPANSWSAVVALDLDGRGGHCCRSDERDDGGEEHFECR